MVECCGEDLLGAADLECVTVSQSGSLGSGVVGNRSGDDHQGQCALDRVARSLEHSTCAGAQEREPDLVIGHQKPLPRLDVQPDQRRR